MGTRILALLAAVAMVAGALWYRSHRDTKVAVSKLRIVCSTEVAAACEAVKDRATTTVEDPTTTYDRLVKIGPGEDPGIDAWIVTGLLPQMADDVRGLSDHLVKGNTTLGSSQIGLAVFADRLAAMTSFCKGSFTWSCLSSVAAKETWKAAGGPEGWGPIKLAIDDPVTTASGLAELGGLETGRVGKDGALPSQDDDPPRNFLDPIARAVDSSATIDKMAAIGPAIAGAAVTLEALAAPVLSGNRNGLTLVYPQPVTPVVAVQTAFYAHEKEIGDELVPAMRDALRRTGWGATADTVFPRSPGLINLRAIWRSVRP